MKSAFHKIIASVRSALEQKPQAAAVHVDTTHKIVPVAPGARRAELASQFARELERVNGHFMGVLSSTEARDHIVALARELEVRTAAVGAGVALDLAKVVKALEQAGVSLIRPHKTTDTERAALREQIANCDLGIVEADYAIASTGTFAVVATPDRPSSLTLLPPANVIIVEADRILPDLAAVIRAIGPATFSSNRVALITGPSRTADIEKMIVLGVHGPKQIYAAAVWR
jgi:L-lactate dehydrogenase complex protein LldG